MTDLQTIDQLTAIECRSLQDYETTIERGLQTFYAVGAALMAIREQRLYRASHSTFEDYCRDRWSMSKTSANRLITAADVVNDLTPIGVIPANEAQARPLASLPPEQRREVWQQVVEKNDKPTARDVQAAVQRHAEPPSAIVNHRRYMGLKKAAQAAGMKLVSQAGSRASMKLDEYEIQNGDEIHSFLSLDQAEQMLIDLGVVAPGAPPEPAPLPDDLRSELSRLGWELRSSRISPAGLHLYTLCSEGGRGATEERGGEGWQQMRDDLLADEQRSIARKIRDVMQRDPAAAYQMLKGVTDSAMRDRLRAEIDAVIDAQKPASATPIDFHHIQKVYKDVATIAIATDGYQVMVINGKTETYREWDVVKARLRVLRVPSQPQLPSAWQFVDRDDALYQARSIIGVLTNAYQTEQDVIDEVWAICDTDGATYDATQTDMYGELLRVAQGSGWTWLGATRQADAWMHYFKHNSSENPLRNSLAAWESTFRGIGGFAVDTPQTLYHLPPDFVDVQKRFPGHLSMDSRTGVFRLVLDGEESTFMHDAWEDVRARVHFTESDQDCEAEAVERILASMTDVQRDLIAIALSTPRFALVDRLLHLLMKQANISDFRALLARIEE